VASDREVGWQVDRVEVVAATCAKVDGVPLDAEACLGDAPVNGDRSGGGEVEWRRTARNGIGRGAIALEDS